MQREHDNSSPEASSEARTVGLPGSMSPIPRCSTCGREFLPGITWTGANYCRAAYVLPYIADHPDLSTWELSEATAISYPDVSRALQKAREWKALAWTEEARGTGDGVRYRYRVVPHYQEIMAHGLKCPMARGWLR